MKRQMTAASIAAKDIRTGVSAAPGLQHRHFAFIAATIAALDDSAMRDHVAKHFGEALLLTNDRFDYGRFMHACDYSLPVKQ